MISLFSSVLSNTLMLTFFTTMHWKFAYKIGGFLSETNLLKEFLRVLPSIEFYLPHYAYLGLFALQCTFDLNHEY